MYLIMVLNKSQLQIILNNVIKTTLPEIGPMHPAVL